MSDSGGRHWLRQLEADPGALRSDPEVLARLQRLLLEGLATDQLEQLATAAWSKRIGHELTKVAWTQSSHRNAAGRLEVRLSISLSTEPADSDLPVTVYALGDGAQLDRVVISGDGPMDFVGAEPLEGGWERIQIGRAVSFDQLASESVDLGEVADYLGEVYDAQADADQLEADGAPE